ncbi:hypothetical protein [Streptomyces sp. NPDC057052]|uniref:hypothetical protein n=1 Tax=Streptomyces sp. NPDC057052 TaxID=3346010 RepID=UPI00362F9726
MVEQQNQRESGASREARQRRSGIVAFFCGLAVSLAFFAFFPGLPHIIDAGAVVVSLTVGVLARWGFRTWRGRRTGKGDG